uniref:autotransporter outer membrane beta-barrel domain-containing protein n=1 Tax=Anaerovibrio sp. TaxID=1872532 RepID=UPI0025E735A1
LDIFTRNNDLVAAIKSKKLDDDTKILVEPRVATTSMINSNLGLLDEVEKNLVKSDFEIIAAVGGADLRTKSGSYVDTRSTGAIVGAARTLKKADGLLTFGAFAEYGRGNYSAHLDNGTSGWGNANFGGLGIFVEKEDYDGAYYGGSLRGGRISTDFRGIINDTSTSYDSDNNYYALHLAGGRKFAVSPKGTMDIYGKAFYTYQEGTGAKLSTGEHYQFGSVNSLRLRLGGRYNYKINDQSIVYAGLAYEYEFGGKATATYQGESAPSPNPRGGSGMLELGWKGKTSKAMTVGVKMNGWVGHKQGIGGTVTMNWEF